MAGKKSIYPIKQDQVILITQKNIQMALRKNIKIGKVNLIIIAVLYFFSINNIKGDNLTKTEKIAELNVLDKVSSKSVSIKVQIGEEYTYQNLIIKVLKCYNSKFDDDPEITAYMQVKDKTITNNDKVFIFNDWTFASSPSIKPFDHPVYDVWLKKCYS